MAHLLLTLIDSNNFPQGLGLWLFLSIGAIALFVVFIPTVVYLGNRRQEREAYYKAETIRRVSEASSDGAKSAIEMLREESRLERIKSREGLKIGGLINVGVGVGLVIFLRVLLGSGANSPFLCGLIPGFIGVAMLVYVYVLAGPIE